MDAPPPDDEHMMTILPDILTHLIGDGELLITWCKWCKEMSDDPKRFQLESFTDGDILQAFASLLDTAFFSFNWEERLNSADEEEQTDVKGRPTSRE